MFILKKFFSDVSLSDTWAMMRGSNPLYYLLAIIVYYASFPLRGIRWGLLLRNAGLSKEGKGLPSLASLTQMMLINWFANVVLFLRVGDIYRPYMLREERDIPYSKSLGTVLAERVIDVLVVVALLGAAAIVLLAGTQGSVGVTYMLLGGGLVVGVVIGLWVLWRFGAKVERLFPSSLRSAWSSFRESAFKSFRQVPLPVALTVAAWAAEVMRLYFVVLALGLHIPLPSIAFVALAYAVAVSIPTTPGGLGLVEGGMTGLLVALNVVKTTALAVTILDRSISFFSLIFVGLGIFGWREAKRLLLARRSHASSAVGTPETTTRPSGE